MSLFDIDDKIHGPLLSSEDKHSLIECVYLGLYVLNSVPATVVNVQMNDDFPLRKWAKEKEPIFLKAKNYDFRFKLQKASFCLRLDIDVPIFDKHFDRPVIELDCSKLCKDDAVGFMYKLSKTQTSPNPIVIIKNITDIPAEDKNHDNPQYVENILLHSWKEESIHLSHKKFGHFSLKSSVFTVLIPIIESRISNIRMDYLRNDGFAYINYVKDLDDFVKSFPESQDWLKNNGYINDIIITALNM